MFQHAFQATASAATVLESDDASEDDENDGAIAAASDASIAATIVIRHSSGVENAGDDGNGNDDHADGANEAEDTEDDNDGRAKEMQQKHLVREVDGSVSAMGTLARPEKHAPRLLPQNHVQHHHHQRAHVPVRLANASTTGVAAATVPARSQLQHITSRAAIKSSSSAASSSQQQQQLSQRHSALAAAFAAAVASATNATPPMKSHKTDAPMLNYIFDSHLATNKHIHHDRFVCMFARMCVCLCVYPVIPTMLATCVCLCLFL